MASIRVDIWSDIACPWCWVGKRHFEAALAAAHHDVEVVWRAFELDPSAPREAPPGMTYAQRLGHKYGVPEAEGQGMIDRMTGLGDSVGLAFRFDRVQPTNTFDAHRLVHWAATLGQQGAFKERMFAAYMNEGRLLADPDVLVEQAEQLGLDPTEARRVLDDGSFSTEVRQDEALATRLGIRGVPFFVFDGQVGVSGAQPSEVLQDVLRQVAEQAAPPSKEPAGGPSCDVPQPDEGP